MWIEYTRYNKPLQRLLPVHKYLKHNFTFNVIKPARLAYITKTFSFILGVYFYTSVLKNVYSENKMALCHDQRRNYLF